MTNEMLTTATARYAALESMYNAAIDAGDFDFAEHLEDEMDAIYETIAATPIFA